MTTPRQAAEALIAVSASQRDQDAQMYLGIGESEAAQRAHDVGHELRSILVTARSRKQAAANLAQLDSLTLALERFFAGDIGKKELRERVEDAQARRNQVEVTG